MIALLPTALPDSEQQLAPFGTWTIGFRNRLGEQIDVEASIQWDDRPLGYPQNGRQSYFIDDRYQRFDEISGREVEVDNESTIKRDGSINAIATGSRTIVAGGYVRKENRVVKYSSGGPISPASGAVQAVNRQGARRLGTDGARCLGTERPVVRSSRYPRGRDAQRVGCRHEWHQCCGAADRASDCESTSERGAKHSLGRDIVRGIWERPLEPIYKGKPMQGEPKVTTQRRHHRSALVRASSSRQRLNERSSAWIGLDDAFSNAEKSTQSA